MISQIFPSKFQQIPIISVSGHCMWVIFKICPTVAGWSIIGQFHDFFKSNVWRVFAIWPKNCALFSTAISREQDHVTFILFSSKLAYYCILCTYVYIHTFLNSGTKPNSSYYKAVFLNIGMSHAYTIIEKSTTSVGLCSIGIQKIQQKYEVIVFSSLPVLTCLMLKYSSSLFIIIYGRL